LKELILITNETGYEWGGYISHDLVNDLYYYSSPQTNKDPFYVTVKDIPVNAQEFGIDIVGIYHTHTSVPATDQYGNERDPELFSQVPDKTNLVSFAINYKLNRFYGYLGTPSGAIKEFNATKEGPADGRLRTLFTPKDR
jgi:hypothetical protein